jgi:hypothetical protein
MMLAGRTGFVAVIVGGLYNPFHTLALEAFLRAIEDTGRQALVVQVVSCNCIASLAMPKFAIVGYGPNWLSTRHHLRQQQMDRGICHRKIAALPLARPQKSRQSVR